MQPATHPQQQQPPPPQAPSVSQPKVAQNAASASLQEAKSVLPSMKEAQQCAQKRQLSLLTSDCKRVCSMDTSPFANLQDAVDRLLPFHVG